MSFLHQLLPPQHPELEACVIVPAKNEANHLNATLTALAKQVDLQGRALRPERWEVLLLVNNSDDDSFGVAGRFWQSHPWFPLRVAECRFASEQAYIGHVRKVLMDEAKERLLRRPKTNSLILSTDADTEVARDWVAQNVAECARGAEAIGGRILLQPGDLRRLDARTREIQEGSDLYHLLISWLEDQCDPQLHDRWPRHHQHFGGSFAIRPEVYDRVGGLPPSQTLEDIALYETLIQQDVKVRHSPDVRVRTSGRMESRTALGLAEQLSRWSQASESIRVPSVDLYETLFLTRRDVRIAWRLVQAGQQLGPAALKSLAASCGAPRTHLHEALRSQHFGAGFESLQVRRKLESGLLGREPLQPLQQALAELQARFQATRPTYSAPLASEVQSDIAAL